MFLIYLIKNMCFLAFFYAYANMIFITPTSSAMIFVYFTILISLAVAYVLNANNKYPKLKYLPILGIFISLLFVKSVTGIIGTIIPYIYVFSVLVKEEYNVNYYKFKDLFINLFYAILPLFLFVFLAKNIDLFNRLSLQYVIIFIISGLYLMRTSRHGKEILNNKKFMLMNSLVIIITSIASIVLSTEAILNVVIIAVKFVYSNVVVPIGSAILYVLFLPMAYFMNKAIKYKEAPPIPFEIPESVEEEAQRIIKEDPSGKILNIIAYIVLTIFLAFVVFIIIKILFSKKKRKIISYTDGIKEQRSFLDDEDTRNKKENQIFNKSINQIRYWYKRFLVLCSKRRMSILENDSSNSIYLKSNYIFKNSESDLNNMKEIYRKARYDKEDIDNQDVKMIKNIYKKLEKEKEEK